MYLWLFNCGGSSICLARHTWCTQSLLNPAVHGPNMAASVESPICFVLLMFDVVVDRYVIGATAVVFVLIQPEVSTRYFVEVNSGQLFDQLWIYPAVTECRPSFSDRIVHQQFVLRKYFQNNNTDHMKFFFVTTTSSTEIQPGNRS